MKTGIEMIAEERILTELAESEDEKIKNRLIKLIKMSNEVGGFALHKWEADEMLTWLEKQREKKSVEENKGNIGGNSSNWSEEDEKIINGLIDSLTRISLNTRTDSTSPNYTFYKEIDWLKSLRPQNHLKPSDEQIKVCKEVYADILSAKGFDLGTVNDELNRMEEELKKLKE